MGFILYRHSLKLNMVWHHMAGGGVIQNKHSTNVQSPPPGPGLYRQSGTFVDTESEIGAKRLPDCLP